MFRTKWLDVYTWVVLRDGLTHELLNCNISGLALTLGQQAETGLDQHWNEIKIFFPIDIFKYFPLFEVENYASITILYPDN